MPTIIEFDFESKVERPIGPDEARDRRPRDDGDGQRVLRREEVSL